MNAVRKWHLPLKVPNTEFLAQASLAVKREKALMDSVHTYVTTKS
jgi:hypothetical protein